jgi:hypothetical protein
MINIVSIWDLPSQRKLVDSSVEESHHFRRRHDSKKAKRRYLFTSGHFQISFVDFGVRKLMVTCARQCSGGIPGLLRPEGLSNPYFDCLQCPLGGLNRSRRLFRWVAQINWKTAPYWPVRLAPVMSGITVEESAVQGPFASFTTNQRRGSLA